MQLRCILQIIKMIRAVIILFVICWTPIKSQQLMRTYFKKLFVICSMSSFYWVTTITITFHWLCMAHSFVNPIIYSFMSKGFRVRILYNQRHDILVKSYFAFLLPYIVNQIFFTFLMLRLLFPQIYGFMNINSLYCWQNI